MMMNKRLLLQVGLIALLSGCYTDNVNRDNIVEGYRPVYGTRQAKDIQLSAARPVKNPGKIYTYKNFLLINEKGEGIHVFDNADPKNPRSVGFVQMLGNSDMAMRDDVLYGDHMGNLVALTVDNFNTVTKTSSLPLQNWELGVPPPAFAHFECIDQSQGVVVRWVKVQLKNPSCYAVN